MQPRLFPVQQEQLTSDDYYTPAWVFERMGIEFDLDVCAPPGGIPWIPAKRYYTQADDGLVAPWGGASLDEPAVLEADAVGAPIHCPRERGGATAARQERLAH